MNPPADDRPQASVDPASGDELATLSGGSGLPTNELQAGAGRPQQQPTFGSGDRVAGRYSIVRFIARGGMGEVYEAEDLQLRERVALKTVRPEIASDERAVERFKREIQLARKVTHPNVCRIFEFGVHQTPRPDGKPGTDVFFLTMELLRGETLASYLRSHGRMTPQEALPLVRQVAEALSAAHRAGVVHRDFKSANVLLVEAGGAERPPLHPPGGAERPAPASDVERLRAVVTDFGLARSSGGDSSVESLVSGMRAMIGTPAYMAPEQVRGQETTAAADIYALGVVLYEMLTGTLPFAGDLQSVVYRRLFEDPTPPRSVVAGIDPRWEQTILRCLEREPADRFQSVSEVVRALEGGEISPGRQERLQAQRRARRARNVAAAAALALLLGTNALLLYHYFRPASATSQLAPAAATRRSVAILGLKNLSGRPDAAWLSTALSELLGTEIAAGEVLRLVPGENVARMRIELQLGDEDSYSKETLARIRQNIGADLVVLGSYLALGKDSHDPIRLDLRLQDATAGETLAAVSETGTEDRLLELISRTGTKFRAKLGIRDLSAAETAELQAAQPATSEAARLYAEGLEKLRLFDTLAARDRLEAASAAEPNNPLIQAALAEAWARLGYDDQLHKAAGRAFELSASLPRAERLAVEGRFRESARDWDGAIKAYQTLFDFFPDNLDHGLRLAAAQIAAGLGAEALATVEELRRLPAPSRDDPRIDLTEAKAAGALSDLRRQVEAAGRAAEKGRGQGARLLVAEARLAAWVALVRMDKPAEAQAACEEAHKLFAEAHDRGGEARALAGLAYVLRYFDLDRRKAIELYEQSVAISRAIGDKRSLANGLRGLGLALRELQKGGVGEEAPKREASLEHYEEALAIFREIGDKSGTAWAMTSVGYELLDAGKFQEAEAQFQEAFDAFQRLGEKDGASNALLWLADIAKMRGALDQTMQRMEQALAIAREAGNTKASSESLFKIAKLLGETGRFKDSWQRLEELLELFSAAADMHGVAQVMHEMGMLALVQGDIAKARTKLEKSGVILKGAAAKPAELDMHQLGLGWVLLFEGRFQDARLQFEEILQRLAETKDYGSRIEAKIGLAYLQLEEGGAAEVEAEFRQALDLPKLRQMLELRQWCQQLLVRSLLDQDRPAEAWDLAEKALGQGEVSPFLSSRLGMAILAAQAQAAARPSSLEQALGILEQTRAEAARAGCYPMELEARLALGRLELATAARREEGRARLEALQKEAEGKGFGYYAHRAARALQEPAPPRKQG